MATDESESKAARDLIKFAMERKKESKQAPKDLEVTHTPFDDSQIRSINEFQKCEFAHPFTCGFCGNTLVATATNMTCPYCNSWFQPWVYSFMADWTWKITRLIPVYKETIEYRIEKGEFP